MAVIPKVGVPVFYISTVTVDILGVADSGIMNNEQ
jgi:hypothetical protein